jgi:hypothetical protein
MVSQASRFPLRAALRFLRLRVSELFGKADAFNAKKYRRSRSAPAVLFLKAAERRRRLSQSPPRR